MGCRSEQILFDHRPGTLHLLRLGDDDGAVRGQRVAGGDELGEHADFAGLLVPSAGFHEAHAAASHHRKAGVPAIAGISIPSRAAAWMALIRSSSPIWSSWPSIRTIAIRRSPVVDARTNVTQGDALG